MPQDKSKQSSGNRQSSGSSHEYGSDRSSNRDQPSSRESESAVNREPSDRSSWSSKSDRSAQRENRQMRDNQQIADDNRQSGVVDTDEVRNRAAEREAAEGSREDAGGISNRGLGDERDSQSRVPRRGESKEDERA